MFAFSVVGLLSLHMSEIFLWSADLVAGDIVGGWAMATLTVGVGTDSARDVPDKLTRHGVKTFTAPGSGLPLVEGCVGWLACRLVPELHNQQAYDLFIGEVVGAWVDERVFRDGR